MKCLLLLALTRINRSKSVPSSDNASSHTVWVQQSTNCILKALDCSIWINSIQLAIIDKYVMWIAYFPTDRKLNRPTGEMPRPNSCKGAFRKGMETLITNLPALWIWDHQIHYTAETTFMKTPTFAALLFKFAFASFLSLPTTELAADDATIVIDYPTTIDLNDQAHRQVIVDREPGQYLGHPTTCLLEDGKTMLCVYPKGHGRGAIMYKRSDDGGLTWSNRLPTPDNWSTSQEVPTLHRVVDAKGKKRIIMWSGLYPARLAVTEDDGANWSELRSAGDWGGIVVMGFVEPLKTGKGHYMAMFHDDGRFFSKNAKRTGTFTLYKTLSVDGGLTWSKPDAVYKSSEIHLCEPGCIRSPDGTKLAVLLRENSRSKNSHVIFSEDEGKTWTVPRELPLSLTGDRHTGKYSADGRLLISFRCNSPTASRKGRPYEGDWVAWVGTWDDIVHGRNGQYSVRFKDNTKGYDTTYPGVEVLPDDTFVVTTYGHWIQGEAPYILSVRLKLSELDEIGSDPDDKQ